MADENRIGAKLRELRESLGLSVEDVAERSSCDVATIEQLEAGEVAPSLAPLIKITRALGGRLATLIDVDAQPGPVVVRTGQDDEADRLKSFETGTGSETLDFFSLAADKASRHMEPLLVTVNPGRDHSLSAHEGQEFIYVLDGAIEIEHGKERFLLDRGDSIYYDAIVPHQVRCWSNDAAHVLAVVYVPF